MISVSGAPPRPQSRSKAPRAASTPRERGVIGPSHGPRPGVHVSRHGRDWRLAGRSGRAGLIRIEIQPSEIKRKKSHRRGHALVRARIVNSKPWVDRGPEHPSFTRGRRCPSALRARLQRRGSSLEPSRPPCLRDRTRGGAPFSRRPPGWPADRGRRWRRRAGRRVGGGARGRGEWRARRGGRGRRGRRAGARGVFRSG